MNTLRFRQLILPFICQITVRMLKEELQLLQEPGSYVGEVVKVMGKSKVLVKVSEDDVIICFYAS